MFFTPSGDLRMISLVFFCYKRQSCIVFLLQLDGIAWIIRIYLVSVVLYSSSQASHIDFLTHCVWFSLLCRFMQS